MKISPHLACSVVIHMDVHIITAYCSGGKKKKKKRHLNYTSLYTPVTLCLALLQSALIIFPWLACSIFSTQVRVIKRQPFRLFTIFFFM